MTQSQEPAGRPLKLDAITHSYGGAVAIESCTLDIAAGELVALLGPSGCGKTTLLRIVAGFVRQTGGRVLVGGMPIDHEPPRARRVGIVFQNYALFPHMTVQENVAYGLRVRRVPQPERRARVAEAMAMVGLERFADRLPRTLSGGQQQRVALARALVIRPLLLLLDEPLANLDARLRQDMRVLIRQVQQDRGITAFYVTHDQAEAMAISDRVAVMERGRVAQFATPREIYQRPVSHYVAAFTGEACQLPVQVIAADGRGRYQVVLEGMQIAVSGPAGLSPGAARALMVRPEAATLAADGLPGIVRSVSFLGAVQRCEVAVGTATLSILAEANHWVAPGDAVHLRIDPALGWLLPEGPA